jgi:hypothetical protein
MRRTSDRRRVPRSSQWIARDARAVAHRVSQRRRHSRIARTEKSGWTK